METPLTHDSDTEKTSSSSAIDNKPTTRSNSTALSPSTPSASSESSSAYALPHLRPTSASIATLASESHISSEISAKPVKQSRFNEFRNGKLLNGSSTNSAESPSDQTVLALPDHSKSAPSQNINTVSRPSKLPFKFDEFMALLSGQSIDQLLIEAERVNDNYRSRVLRMNRQLINQNPCYLNSNIPRRRFEIAFIKLSVFQRIVTSMRESHRILGLPIDVQQLDITAEWAAASAIVPLFWNYRLMTIPIQTQSGFATDNSTSFPDDAYHFGLLMAESLLSNSRFDKVIIRERIVTQTVTINSRYQHGKALGANELKSLYTYLNKVFEQPEFSFRNIQFDPDYKNDDSIHIQAWRDALFMIFRLTSRIPGFSFYHSGNEEDKQVISQISQEVSNLVQTFKLKMMEPENCDLSIATLLQDILRS